MSRPISDGGMGLKRIELDETRSGRGKLAPMCETRRRNDRGSGAPNAEMDEAALPCQQAVKLEHANFVGNEGVDAIKAAGTNSETLHLSCRAKLQQTIALKIMSIRRADGSSRPMNANVKSHCRVKEKPTQWSRSVGQSRTRLRKNDEPDQHCARAVRIRMGLPLASPNSTSKVYQRARPRLRGKKISVWADPRMAVQELLGTRSAYELLRPCRNRTIRQRTTADVRHVPRDLVVITRV